MQNFAILPQVFALEACPKVALSAIAGNVLQVLTLVTAKGWRQLPKIYPSLRDAVSFRGMAEWMRIGDTG